MAKISTYSLSTAPLSLSDKLIGTEVGGPIPLATKNFSLGELLTFFNSQNPALNLQNVLNGGNTATQDINLIGDIQASDAEFQTLYLNYGLYDSTLSPGSPGDVLISTGSGTVWGPGGGGSTYLFQDGLTQTGSIVRWGGTLTQPVTIDAQIANSITFDNVRNFFIYGPGFESLMQMGQFQSTFGKGISPERAEIGAALDTTSFKHYSYIQSQSNTSFSSITVLDDEISIDIDSFGGLGKLKILNLQTEATPTGYEALIIDSTTNEVKKTAISTASGTVTSVGLTAGTGISLSGTNPITSSGTITVTNSAPDQVVALTPGSGIGITGTYPNFTITNSSPNQPITLTQGSGISITGSDPNFTIINSAPDQVVSLGNGTGINVTGTYPNFTIANTAPDQTVVLTQGSGISITGTYPNFTIAATGGSGSGTVTSVGLSMPSAFTVAGSPVTTSGTLAVTAAGTAVEYIRGDGTLGQFPTGGGGGGGTVYYLNGNTSQGTIAGTTMYQLSKLAGTGAAADFTRSTTGTIASFITDVNQPNQTTVPAGIWIFECYFSETGGGANHATIQCIVEKWDGTTITVIGTGIIEEITNGPIKDLYTLGVTIPNGVTLSVTDRIVVQIQIANPQGKTVTLYTEDSSLSSVTTTFANGIASLNGISESTQVFAVGTAGVDFGISSAGSTHTFNLPTASSSNRGALSSADWTTFNNKQDTITLTNTGSSGAATLIGTTLNIPNYTLSGLGGVPDTRTISTTAPLSGGGDLSVNRILSIQDAAADNTTKGAATFASADFNATLGLISIDYANGQSASASNKGFLTSADWTTFNNKQNQVALTTTGSTGAATFNPSTGALNIPQYGGTGGSGFGYTLVLGFNSSTLAASETYVMGTLYGSGAVELFNNRPSRWVLSPKVGSVVSASLVVQLNSATYGSPTSSQLQFRVHNITQGTNSVIDAAYQITSGLFSGGATPARNTFYSITPLAINQGDQIQVRVVTPAWTVVPAAMSINVILFIE